MPSSCSVEHDDQRRIAIYACSLIQDLPFVAYDNVTLNFILRLTDMLRCSSNTNPLLTGKPVMTHISSLSGAKIKAQGKEHASLSGHLFITHTIMFTRLPLKTSCASFAILRRCSIFQWCLFMCLSLLCAIPLIFARCHYWIGSFNENMP